MSESRRTKAKTFTLDEECIELLELLTPTRKAHGRVLSELIRTEFARREAKNQARQELLRVLSDTTQDSVHV